MISSTTKLLEQLEHQLEELVNKLHTVEQTNRELKQVLMETNEKLEKKHEMSRTWQEKYEALKLAQGMNSGDAIAKKRARHHIDALISEVDACIAQLEIIA